MRDTIRAKSCQKICAVAFSQQLERQLFIGLLNSNIGQRGIVSVTENGTQPCQRLAGLSNVDDQK